MVFDAPVLYAPAICHKCGRAFRSDVPIAEPPWITPIYRSVGGACPNCGGKGLIPGWVYQFHTAAVQSRAEATEHQKRSQIAALDQHIRRHRTAKRTQAFVQSFRDPWSNLIRYIKAAPPRERRAQLIFLRWIIKNGTE